MRPYRHVYTHITTKSTQSKTMEPYKIPNSQSSIIITPANLLDQEGVSIIHCPTQFETSPDVITPHSLIQQFVALAQDANLDNQIETWCNRNSHSGTSHNELPHRKLVFPRGTLCPVTVHHQQYYLAAFNDSSSQTDLPSLSVDDYIQFWNNLWSDLRTKGCVRGKVSVPVPGGMKVNVDNSMFDINQKLGVIVTTFFSSIKNHGGRYNLQICLYGDDAQDVNSNHWHDVLLPYLYNMSFLEIDVTKPKATKVETLAMPAQVGVANLPSSDVIFISHLSYMFQNLVDEIGKTVTQYRSTYHVNVSIDGLDALIQILTANAVQLHTLLGEDNRTHLYDRNLMYQLLNFLYDKTNILDKLTRRNAVKIMLDTDCKPFPYGFDYLKSVDEDNFDSYVGEKKPNDSFKALLDLLPDEYKKKKNS